MRYRFLLLSLKLSILWKKIEFLVVFINVPYYALCEFLWVWKYVL